MFKRKPNLIRLLLCATALLTMGTEDGCGGDFPWQCGDGICDLAEDEHNCAADCGSPSDVRPSAGCGLAGDSGRQDLTVTIRGVQRTYRVQFP
ncbi:MAG: hypothetical protein WBM74_04485, partial [Polyangiales bacterium]